MHFGVLKEVVTKVAAPFEHFAAAINSAREINFVPFCALAGNFEGLVPGPRDAAEALGQEVEPLAPRALTWVWDDTHVPESHLKWAFLLHSLSFTYLGYGTVVRLN